MTLPCAYIISDLEAARYNVPVIGKTDLVQESIKILRSMIAHPTLWAGFHDYDRLIPLFEMELGSLSVYCNSLPKSYFDITQRIGARGLRRLLTVWPQENQQKTQELQKEALTKHLDAYLSWLPNHLLASAPETLTISRYSFEDYQKKPDTYRQALQHEIRKTPPEISKRTLITGPSWLSSFEARVTIYTLQKPLPPDEKISGLYSIIEEAQSESNL